MGNKEAQEMRTVRDMAQNDELWTPPDAIDPLLPYLPGKLSIVWEMCPGSGKMIEYFTTRGYAVVDAEGDSLKTEPFIDWDVIVTNPPWSKKHLFLQRCIELDSPFALLLPIRTLGVRRCQVWLDDVDILFLRKRVDFTGGGSPYEACAWFTRHLLPHKMVFET
jgi:hypothetical protein